MIEPGEVVAGRYTIVARARAGAMGTVFRGQDAVTGRAVAVKVVETDDDADAARFEREVDTLTRLDHPGIVRYVDHGGLADRACFLVMDWLEGESVATRLSGAGMTVREAAEVGAAAAEALAHAHRRGLVHRDVKPDNILLPDPPAPGAAVLVDFGVARAIAPSAALTRTGHIVGTPGYLAPEQARGDRDIDGRADAFALGCTIYECMSGRRAFDGASMSALLVKVLLADPVPLAQAAPDVPSALASLVDALMAKDPGARPSDLDGVAATLHRHAPPAGGRAARVAPNAAPTARGPSWLVLCTPDPDGEPVAGDAAADRVERARQALAGEAVDSLAPLRDGSLAVAVAARGGPPVQGAAAARAALALRAAFPGDLIAVAAGASPSGSIDACARLVEAASLDAAVSRVARDATPIHLDRATAEVLRGAFDVTSERGRFLLRGPRLAL